MPKGYYKPLTKADEQKIKDEFLLKPVKRLANELGITYGRIMRFLKRNELEIPRELIEQRKKDSQKKKGDIPFNKGKKQVDYMSAAAIEKTKNTRFKKGNIPHNAVPEGDGAIRIRRESSSELSYKYIRVSLGKWVLYHRHLWEQRHGVIPKGYCLAFKDGDTMNCDLTNLELITRTENMYRNSRHNYPKEIIPSLVLSKQIEHKLNSLQDG